MTKLVFFLLLLTTPLWATTTINVATFDSGFGGYFTAKEIERASNELLRHHAATIRISHYGDTAHAPYGEKTPELIAALSARGIRRAFSGGAEVVFIACNTASTQFAAIQKLLEPAQRSRVVSIIDRSVAELKSQIDLKLTTKSTVNVVILATPATLKARAYLRALADAYGTELRDSPLSFHTQERWFQKKSKVVESAAGVATLELPGGKRITITQVGPANWVEMIEHGAPRAVKQRAIKRDLTLLSSEAPWDVVGEFCTHFPAVDDLIKQSAVDLGLAGAETVYIKQGPLMAGIFRQLVRGRLGGPQTAVEIPAAQARIFISGGNVKETQELAREIFPQDPLPTIERINF